MDEGRKVINLCWMPNSGVHRHTGAICAWVAVVGTLLGPFFSLISGQIAPLFVFPIIFIAVAVLIYLVMGGIAREEKKHEHLLETGVCYDARIDEIKPDYLNRSSGGSFRYRFFCSYTDGGGVNRSIKSHPIELHPDLLGKGWMGDVNSDTALGLLLDIGFLIADAVKAGSERPSIGPLTARAWLNPKDCEDYYIEVFYPPPEEATLSE